jgi:hypothetical protein
VGGIYKTQRKKSNIVCDTIKNESRRGWNPHQISALKFGEGSIHAWNPHQTLAPKFKENPMWNLWETLAPKFGEWFQDEKIAKPQQRSLMMDGFSMEKSRCPKVAPKC